MNDAAEDAAIELFNDEMSNATTTLCRLDATKKLAAVVGVERAENMRSAWMEQLNTSEEH